MQRSIIIATTAALMATAAGAYEMPIRGNDLLKGELFHTRVHKAAGGQDKGKDINLYRFVSAGKWTRLKSEGADEKNLDNHLIYGKPFYAMADGVVVSCWRNAPQNTPGSYHAEYQNNRIPGGGNMLWIEHDDGSRALYAHAQTGSIPARLCPHNAALYPAPEKDPAKIAAMLKVTGGARIRAGDMLGRIGNAGASEGGPHLHVHINDGSPVPMPFARGMTMVDDATNTLDGPWIRTAGKIIPEAKVFVWPPRIIGNYTFNGIARADYQRLAEHLADSKVMPNLITCANNGATLNSTWVPAQGLFNTHHDMDAATAAAKHAEYTKAGFKRTSNFVCGSKSVAVWKK